jgi:hypothetical protein
MATVHNEPPLCLQLFEAPRKHKFLVRRIHDHTSLDGAAADIPINMNIGMLLRKRQRRT